MLHKLHGGDFSLDLPSNKINKEKNNQIPEQQQYL
jgi:hypothetical protein